MTFRAELRNLIDDSHRRTWMRFDEVKRNPASYGLSPRALKRWTTPGEPAFVSGLLTYWASARLGRLLISHLSPGRVAGRPLVSGVFVHQKPYVEYGTPAKRVEIGDLLIVRHHFTLGVLLPQGRAVLIQAKRNKHPRTGRLKDKDAEQFDLYANWDRDLVFPNGELGRAPSGDSWNLSLGPGATDDTGRYGVVASSRPASGPPFPDNCTWAIGRAMPVSSGARSIICSHSMAALLEAVLNGTGGRPWHSDPPPSDHWSHFVERMTINAAGWSYPLHTMAAKKLPRARRLLMPLSAHLDILKLSAASLPSWSRARAIANRVDRNSAAKAIEEQVEQWQASVHRKSEVFTDGGDGGSDGIPRDGGDFGEPAGGVSVLYVCTFGESCLGKDEGSARPE